MMTSGGGVQTGGQRAAQDLVEKRAQEAKARLAKGLGNGKDSGGNGSGGGMSSSSPSSSLAARATGWAKTGVVSLRGEGIDEVPLEVRATRIILSETERERQIDRQAERDRQTDRQRERGRQTDTDRQSQVIVLFGSRFHCLLLRQPMPHHQSSSLKPVTAFWCS